MTLSSRRLSASRRPAQGQDAPTHTVRNEILPDVANESSALRHDPRAGVGVEPNSRDAVDLCSFSNEQRRGRAGRQAGRSQVKESRAGPTSETRAALASSDRPVAQPLRPLHGAAAAPAQVCLVTRSWLTAHSRRGAQSALRRLADLAC